MKSSRDLRPIETQIVEFLKRDKRISWDGTGKGMVVDREWVKALLVRCAHAHWVAMAEYEDRVSGKGKAELGNIGAKLAAHGWGAQQIEEAKEVWLEWHVQQRGGAGQNLHPPGGPPITPLHEVYIEVWTSWGEAGARWPKEAGFKRFAPNINSNRYGHDHDRPDRHDFWNPPARLLLKIIEWLGYTEPNVRGLIDTMNKKRKRSRRITPPIRS